jgi:fatty-acid desaturase
MNWYFYKVWLPLQLLTVVVAIGIFNNYIVVNWLAVAVSFFFIGPVGIGVGFHRLFSHRSFRTSRPIEVGLAILGTFAGYAPLLFWTAVHYQHHVVSDTVDDPSSPQHFGFWESFFNYRMRKETLSKVHIKNFCVREILRDRYLVFISRHFLFIFWAAIFIVGLFGLNWLASLMIIPIFFEHLRINITSSLSHMPIPFSYRNHATEDQSQNNLLLGLLSFGFGWHNNHHNSQRTLSLREKWWELDIEGIVGWLLSIKENS